MWRLWGEQLVGHARGGLGKHCWAYIAASKVPKPVSSKAVTSHYFEHVKGGVPGPDAPKIQALPAFWEHLVLAPLPNPMKQW